MALIICAECGKEISDKAKHCIYCGNPTEICEVEAEALLNKVPLSNSNTIDRKKGKKSLIALITISLALLIVLVWIGKGIAVNSVDGNDGEQQKTYEYSDYVNREDMEDELLEWFEKYDIRFYDGAFVDDFPYTNLPKPETIVVGFPSYEMNDDAYIYRFDTDEEVRVFTAAYMVYLMNLDYEVNELNDNVYSIDDEYYFGLGMDDGDYILLIMEP